jgi:hypothetical protein
VPFSSSNLVAVLVGVEPLLELELEEELLLDELLLEELELEELLELLPPVVKEKLLTLALPLLVEP